MAKSIPLSKFKKFKAEIHMDEAILKSASSMVTELKRDSPNGYRHKKKYRSTWTSTFYPKEHRALAREVAQKSIVLLKNKDGLLPLKDKFKKIQK